MLGVYVRVLLLMYKCSTAHVGIDIYCLHACRGCTIIIISHIDSPIVNLSAHITAEDVVLAVLYWAVATQSQRRSVN